jgi:hypothetical protein
VGAVTARGLGWALLALVVGASLGVGAAYATRPEPESSGTPAPVPAKGPPAPENDPYAPDIRYPPLGKVTDFGTHRIGNPLQAWEYPAPAGWVSYRVPGDIPTPVDRVEEWDEVRWRPLGEPTEGGYSMRVKAIDNHHAPADEVRVKASDFELLYEDVVVLEQTNDAVLFTFRTEDDLFRVNFFQWFAAPDSTEATLEMSVAGRRVDRPGMRALFDEFAERAQAVDD